MCGTCNTIKNENWITGNSRCCINFYFDNLTNYKTLYAKLIKKNDLFIVDFKTIKPDNVSDKDYEIIINHFKTYDLKTRYTKSSITIISQLTLKMRLSIIDIERHKENLASEIEVNNIIYGLNYWKNCIYEAVLESDEFWTSF